MTGSRVGRVRAGALTAAGLSLAVLAAGCTDGASSSAEPRPTATASERDSAPAPSGGVPDPNGPVDATPTLPPDEAGGAGSPTGLDTAPTGSTAPVEATAQGNPSVLFRTARVAAQSGFDRVVFEYKGDGVPGYRFLYQAEANQQATGDVVDLPGSTGLRGFIDGIAWQDPANYDGPKRISGPGTQNVTVLDVGILFEAMQDPYIGVQAERPFRVTVLRDPTRIVVDIAH